MEWTPDLDLGPSLGRSSFNNENQRLESSDDSSDLLLGCDVDRRAGGFPVHVQRATVARLFVGDGEILDRRGQLRIFHVEAGVFVLLVLVGNAPFGSLLIDDQRPFVGVGNGEEGVAASRDILASNLYVSAGHKGCGLVGAGAPNFSERHKAAENLASLGART